MIITIDTNKDSVEDIATALQFLQELLQKKTGNQENEKQQGFSLFQENQQQTPSQEEQKKKSSSDASVTIIPF